MTRRLAVIVNPTAGGGRAREVLAAARTALERLGADFRVIESTSPDHAREEARRAVDAGETVAALGGDGLIGTLAGDLCGSESALAIVPGGRGNDLARVLGIPTEPGEAARVAWEGEESLIDVVEVEGKTYVTVATCGHDSEANRIANEAKILRGNLVYAYAGLRALATEKAGRFEVTVDGERHVATAATVAVGNSKAYGGGMYLLPQAELDDGLIDVLIYEDRPRLTLLRAMLKALKGTFGDDAGARFYRGETVEISADRPFVLYADGDPLAELPVTVRVRPRVLRVIVPRR